MREVITNKNILEYIDGNAAKNLQVERQPVRRYNEEQKKLKNRYRKAHRNSLKTVLFFATALLICGYVLIGYVRLQSQLTSKTRQIARLESNLNDLKLSNDEELNRINSKIDLEEVKRVAIGELGMTYATEGQIVTYNSSGKDYMRKVAQAE